MSSRAHRLTPLLSLISLNSPQLPDLKRAHALLIVSGALTPKPIARRLVSLYCLRSIDDSVLLHSQLQWPDPISSNLILKFLVRSSQPMQVLSFFSQQVHPIGCRPSKCTFPLLITAAKLCKSTDYGRLLHSLAVKIGFMFHAPIPNSLIHMYSSFAAFNDAIQVFDEMPNRDIVSYNTVLSGYVKKGDLQMAESLFSSMPEDNVISWSILFKGYVRNRQFEKSLCILYQMLIHGVIPDEHTIVTLLSVIACFKLIPYGKMVHGFVIKRWFKVTEHVRIALINFYCKCGYTDCAISLFKQTRTKSVSLWNTLISGIGSLGVGKEALEIFTLMQMNGVRPNEDTFTCLLLICGNEGLVKEGLRYFDMMKTLYGMKPTLAHHWCLVNLFVCAGRSDEALKIEQKLPLDSQSSIWDALVCLSKESSDISIGEYLGRRIIELEPDNPTRYMPLMNLYAAAARKDKYWELMYELKQRHLEQLSDHSTSQVV